MLGSPFAVGDSSGNIPLRSMTQAVMTRWVARRAGTVRELRLRLKTEGSSRCGHPGDRRGYAGGNGGVLVAVTYPVLRSGRPDVRAPLERTRSRPCDSARGESIALRLNLRVSKGEVLATVVHNADRAPRRNYFSQNFLYVRGGILGANARNELRPSAPDARYGLDSREAVGYSRDGGRTWRIPGGPYGPHGGRSFLPTYVLVYRAGPPEGQPYYSATPVSGPITMIYRAREATTVAGVAAIVAGRGAALVKLSVDGRYVSRTRLHGHGLIAAPIAPRCVAAGAVVRLETTAGRRGLRLRAMYAGAQWARLLGLGPGYAYYMRQAPDFAVPLFPVWGIRCEPDRAAR